MEIGHPFPAIREHVIACRRKTRLALALAMAFLPACTSSRASQDVVEVRQADTSDGGAAAPGEYPVFGAVAVSTPPDARNQTALVFDPVNGRSLLFGGRTLNGPLADVWTYDGAWQRACGPTCPSGPTPFGSVSAAFAKARGALVVFGGYLPPSPLCQTWEWTAANGFRLALDPACTDGEGVNARRVNHAMADLGDEVVAFGGNVQSGSTFPRSNALLRWNGSAWTVLCDDACAQASGTLPSPRTSATLSRASDGGQDVLLLFGGASDGGAENDTWKFDPVAVKWTELCTSSGCRSGAPPARLRHGAAFDSARRKLVVHGGCKDATCSPPLGDAYEYDLAADAWTKVSSIHPGFPDAKSDFGMTFDAKRGRVVEFGGLAGGPYLNRTVEYYTRGAPCSAARDCDTGTCVKQHPGDAQGVCAEPCSDGDGGLDGACVNGFRCNEACAEPCQTCAAVPGICTAITSGPDDELGDLPASRCNGVHACAPATSGDAGRCLLVSGQTCGDGSECTSGNCGRYGNKVCSDPACGDRPCRPSSQSGTCTVFGAGHFVPECQGFGCGTDGNCLEKCDGDDDCDPAYYCDTDGKHDCKRGKRFGAGCKTSEECGRGTCYDGVCCEQPCGLPCERCGSDGRCVALGAHESPLPGHPACLGAESGICGGYCDGDKLDCFYPSVPCGAGTCVGHDSRFGDRCENGSCVAYDGPQDCGAFSCNQGECNTECNTDQECRLGAVCRIVRGTGTCSDQGVTCGADGFSVKTVTGSIVSCRGYPCIGTACSVRPCTTASDCAPGYTCNADHACVEAVTPHDAGRPPPPGTPDAASSPDAGPTGKTVVAVGPERKGDGGAEQPGDGTSCAVARRGGRGSPLLVGFAAALALGVRRLRRRSRRS